MVIKLPSSPSPHRTLILLVGLVITLEAAINLAYAFNYSNALEMSLLFFEAQRSGKLPPEQRVKWRHDSALTDGQDQGLDLTGGYYDAGDNVKFGLPMAFSVTMLAWGVVEFENELRSSSQLENTLEAIKWGTDFLIKAHPQDNVLYGQVGDGKSDHLCWQRPEDMTTSRTAYKIDSDNPGSDLAGETAAAMAAGSMAFKDHDPAYSTLLLGHAQQLFEFADQKRGFYHDSIKSAEPYYHSQGYNDELLLAATLLYRATNDGDYLKYVVDNFDSLAGPASAVKESSWDNTYAAVQILISGILLVDGGGGGEYNSTLEKYQTLANYFACACLQKNDYSSNVQTTPGGLVFVRKWNNLEYSSSAAFLLAVYSEYLTKANAVVTCPNNYAQLQPGDLLNFAKSQADYILGNNPMQMSYLVGFGEKFPKHVHHRGSSIPSVTVLQSAVECNQGYSIYYSSSSDNPNVLYGALVGGPDQNDRFTDDRSNFEQTEATTSATSTLPALFAKLQSMTAGSYNQELVKSREAPSAKKRAKRVPLVVFTHKIINTYTDLRKGITYYVHMVKAKNNNQMPLRRMKVKVDNLTGYRHVFGLVRTNEDDIFELKQEFQPGSVLSFVYVQSGPQALFSVHSYASSN